MQSTIAQNKSEKVIVSTFAGGRWGFADGQGSAAGFRFPVGIAIDAAGNLYVTEGLASRAIRKVTPKGEVSTLMIGRKKTTDEQGIAKWFNWPHGITADAAGNLYVTDVGVKSCIFKVTPEGKISILAGSRKRRGFADRQGISARFKWPFGITIDAVGNLYVADAGNHRIRKVTPEGAVSTLAGSERGFADGEGSAARFAEPTGIAIDAVGNLYVVDHWNHCIRKVTPEGKVSTLAGSGKSGLADGEGSMAQFYFPHGITIDAAGTLYVADTFNDCIRKVTPKGEVSTLAGSGKEWRGSLVDGQGGDARFDHPHGIAIDAEGNLYVADRGNWCIRKITMWRIHRTTVSAK